MNALEAAERLAGRRGRVLLDSASDADRLGRWSFAAANPVAELEARGPRGITVRGRGGEVAWRGEGDPLELLDRMAREHGGARAADGDAPVPVAIGWVGYEVGRALMRLPARAADPRDEPDLWFGFYGAVYRRDEQAGRGEVVGADGAARAQLEAALVAAPVPGRAAAPAFGALDAEDAGDAAYRAGFERVADYLRAGDCYQVNLARRLVGPVERGADPLELYRRIVRRSPAPCGALLEPGDGWSVVSSSPERFLSRAPDDDRVETRPIKGTRRRAGRADEDARLSAELAADDKERAEHLMIVDLERNDLGRVARTGTVTVDSFARAVELPTVHHLVSTVSCRLDDGVGVAELLRATFPGGSVTGAPKLRAMQIIDELEPFRRGVYTGAIGYLGQGGALDLSIAIRTAVLSPARLTVAVGGGVVADSTLERELEETEEKAAAWRAAVADA